MIEKMYNKKSIPQNISSFKTNEVPNPKNSFPQNFPQRFEKSLDSPNQQEIIPEILNISKIKDGFFVSDKLSAISLDVINEFKITHIINCTGEEVINQWESLGIDYLTINWSENSNQILFDIKDEIADKIVEFIDRSLLVGEGILAHSFNGKNRVCIVALIYLMKKYKWSLPKSLQYLKSKKNDVEITNYFYIQLENFQKRLILKGELTRDIPWEFENLIDDEEKLLRNTYINGLPPNIEVKENENNRIIELLIGDNNNENYVKKKHIIWADNNPYSFQNGKIEIFNLNNDLCLKKDIKIILFHLQHKPIKPCIKNNRNKKSGIQFNVSINANNNINIIKQKINFENSDRNIFRNEYNEYINKLENVEKKVYNNNYNNIKGNKLCINNLDKNISDNNTNSNTPAEEVKDLFDNKSNDFMKNKFTFNIGSINSLNPSNINNFKIFEEDFNKKSNNLYSKNNEINIIKHKSNNYPQINDNEKKINNINNANNNISNYAIGFNKKNKNQNINNKNGVNKQLNNLNPNLIGNKNQSINEKENYYSSHPFFNKNKYKQNAPVKIKNYNNNCINIIKKPGTPILNHVNNSSNLASQDNLKNTKNLSTRSNSNKKSSSFSNNTNPPAISFNNNANIKNSIHNHYNKSSSERPSTAPHKDKTKSIKIINFNSNINPKTKSNLKSSIKSKIKQRPLSAENKDKIKINNLGKNYLSNNIKNNAKINNYYNNIYGTDNNKEINKNNVKSNDQKINVAKQRRQSPIIKSNNIFNKNIIK